MKFHFRCFVCSQFVCSGNKTFVLLSNLEGNEQPNTNKVSLTNSSYHNQVLIVICEHELMKQSNTITIK